MKNYAQYLTVITNPQITENKVLWNKLQVGPGGVAISFPNAEAIVGAGGISVSRPVAVSQAGFGGVAVAGGESFASAGFSPDEKNQVFLVAFIGLFPLLMAFLLQYAVS